MEYQLGLCARLDGMYLKRPQLPSGWPSCKATRQLNGCTFELHIERGANEQLTVDDVEYDNSKPLECIDGKRYVIHWVISSAFPSGG